MHRCFAFLLSRSLPYVPICRFHRALVHPRNAFRGTFPPLSVPRIPTRERGRWKVRAFIFQVQFGPKPRADDAKMATQEHRYAGIVPTKAYQETKNTTVGGNPAVLAARTTAEAMTKAEQVRFELTPSSSEWRIKHHRNTQMEGNLQDSQETEIEHEKDTEVLQETQVLPKDLDSRPKTTQRPNAGSVNSVATKIIRVVEVGQQIFYRYKDISSLAGTVKDKGFILCSHCNEVLTPTNFQRHAGDKRKGPFLSSCFTVKDGIPVTLQELFDKDEGQIRSSCRTPHSSNVLHEPQLQKTTAPMQSTKKKTPTQRADIGKPTSILELLGSQNNPGGSQNIFAQQQPKRMLNTAPNPRFSLSQPSPSRIVPYTPTGHNGAARVLFPAESREPSPPEGGATTALAEVLQELKTHWSEEKPEQVKRSELLSNVQKICSRLETDARMHQQQLESRLQEMQNGIIGKVAERDAELASWLDVVESRLEGLQIICLNLPELIASVWCDFEAQKQVEEEKIKHAPSTPSKDQKYIGLFAEDEVAHMSEDVSPQKVNHEEVLLSLKSRIKKAKLAERIRGAKRAAYDKNNPFYLGSVKNAVYAILAPQSSMGQGLTVDQIELAVKELRKLDQRLWPHTQKASRLRSIICKALKNESCFYSQSREGGKQRYFVRYHPEEGRNQHLHEHS